MYHFTTAISKCDNIAVHAVTACSKHIEECCLSAVLVPVVWLVIVNAHADDKPMSEVW